MKTVHRQKKEKKKAGTKLIFSPKLVLKEVSPLYPLHQVIPITDTPKRIPITPSDTHTPSSQNPPKSSPITLRDPVFLANRPDTQ
jgi:hypothetical protein